MRLSRKFDQALMILTAIFVVVFLGVLATNRSASTFADSEEINYTESGARFVTFYDGGNKLTVKTEARTVEEALGRAGIVINTGDIVEPKLEAEINADEFFVNIYRARPVVVRDGTSERYLMTASFDKRTIVEEAGITVYDGDEISLVPNTHFLENGVANVYELTRNGGRTVTVEEEIPFAEETVRDASIETGKSEVRQLGEVGTKRVYYKVLYKDNQEVSREVVREEIVREPVARVTAVGAKKSLPPEAATCAEWVRQAGVAESDVEYAIQLIYRESGCRVDATNASSGAYGIPQALPGHKMASAGADWETNPVTQIRWMAGYVSRWGGWAGALNQQVTHGWY